MFTRHVLNIRHVVFFLQLITLLGEIIEDQHFVNIKCLILKLMGMDTIFLLLILITTCQKPK